MPAPNFEDGGFIANDGSTRCTQERASEIVGTLDCLKLNIHIPSQASSSNLLPVLVHIHGGGFSGGSAGFGVKNLVRHGIVVVTINYRLGAYGFLCLNTPSVPGNQGLKDQYEALVWVRKNIAAFGGDPNKITIGGESAGACSTLLHLYSHKPKLFNNVIAQSGTPQNEGMFILGDEHAATKLALQLGFNTSDTEEALQFLTKTPSDLVVGATNQLGMILRPCREKSFSGVENFIDTDPMFLSNRTKVANTPILMGHTSKEENRLKNSNYETDPFYKKIADNFYLNDDQLMTVSRFVRHFYIGDEPLSKDIGSKILDFESDFVFNHAAQRQITKLVKEDASPIYEYVLTYVDDPNADGPGHAAESLYLFDRGDNITNNTITDNDQLIIDRLTMLWANFVKYRLVFFLFIMFRQKNCIFLF